ncbi:MAG TPA: tetratricopeptide repeat protein [Thermoanaerobaculia bacterium]|nr:tetratricopeptide repeat protein [Thermoanaerobaculia bacterium]
MRSWLGFVAMLLLLSAPSVGRQKAPRGAQGQIKFGVDMAQRGLWSEALFRFRQAERMGDERPAVLNNIAVAYEALGQFDQAQDYYKKALELDPRNAGLKRNYSRFVEFYQSFKPDQPAAPSDGELAPTGGDGAAPASGAPAAASSEPSPSESP